MFGLFNRKVPEVEMLLNKIDAAVRRLPTDLAPVGEPLLKQLANTVKIQWKDDHRRNYAKQINEGEMHEAFIYNFVVHAVGNKLESGRYHAYRGVLNEEGHQYKRLFEHAIDTMIDMEGYTAEWAQANLREPVYKSIREAG